MALIDIEKPVAYDGERSVKYTNRDFLSLREALIQFAKDYYPNSYNDFSPGSIGMMFIEMIAYVGDVLNFYIDHQYKESFIQYASDRKTILLLSKYLGYKTKPARGSVGEVELFQICPSIRNGSSYVPDMKYALFLRENMQLSSNDGSSFITLVPVDFSVNTDFSPRKDSVFSRKADGTPQFFLLSKTVPVMSGKIVTKTFTVATTERYLDIPLEENNVLKILEVTDSDGNSWHETDYLCNDQVFISIPNVNQHDKLYYRYRDSVSFILKSFKTHRRFVVDVDSDNITHLKFGYETDDDVGREAVSFDSKIIRDNILKIKDYNFSNKPYYYINSATSGISPRANTVLTIKYIVGGGIESNAPSNSIVNIVSSDVFNLISNFNPEEIEIFNLVKSSLKVINPKPLIGGKGPETNEEIKNNAIAFFKSQNRAVTNSDYEQIIYSMPSIYGSVAKVYVENNSFLDDENIRNNSVLSKESLNKNLPFLINVYVLGYDNNQKLTNVNEAIVNNIKEYIKQYRMLSDRINILNAYIINIGIQFAVEIYRGKVAAEVINSCKKFVSDYFDITKWSINQPINLNSLQVELCKLEGVKGISKIKVTNKTIKDGLYSNVEYDIDSATVNGIIYPSRDPSIFEVKYPDVDILVNSI